MDIGQKVKVIRLRDRVSSTIAQKLGEIGIIEGYKVTDGKGIGVVVKFDDNFSTWFFEDEIKPA
jgi:Fe2+ transport system protein FeoA